MYLEELFLTLLLRKKQDRIGALYPPGLGVLENALSFCLGKGHGKLGKLAMKTIGYRATNTSVKKIENIEKRQTPKWHH